MAGPELRVLLVALALAAGACDRRTSEADPSSITVKLPPPRPHAPAPAFRAVANNSNPAQSP
jgi:hypothetical protein